jgi:hypothetical protein
VVFIQQAVAEGPVLLVVRAVEVLAVRVERVLQTQLPELLGCLHPLPVVVEAERKLVVRAEPAVLVAEAQVVLMLPGFLVRQTLVAAVAVMESRQLLAATAAAAS